MRLDDSRIRRAWAEIGDDLQRMIDSTPESNCGMMLSSIMVMSDETLVGAFLRPGDRPASAAGPPAIASPPREGSAARDVGLPARSQREG